MRDMLYRDFSGLIEDANMERYRQGLAMLTPREVEVFLAMLEYEPSKVIAARLGIKKTTVDKHRSRILQRTGVKSSLELIVLAKIVGTSVGSSPG